MNWARWLVFAVMFFILATGFSTAATNYVSQNGGVFSGGSACNGKITESIATFNVNTPAVGGEVDILCGAITSQLKINGPGAAGNVNEILADSGASIQLQGSANTCPIAFQGAYNHWLFDGGGPGGTNGILAVLNNGSSPLATQNPVSAFCTGMYALGDIEVRNWMIGPLYQHTSLTDTTSNADTGTVGFFLYTGPSANISIHDNVMHDLGVGVLIYGTPSNNPTISVYNNYIYNMDWGIGPAASGTASRTLLIHDNHFGSTVNWDTTSDTFHHDGIHFYDASGVSPSTTAVYNNLVDGDWGNCCSTAFIYVEYHPLNNFLMFNNVVNQHSGNVYPLLWIGNTGGNPGITTGDIVNNTFQCGGGPSTNTQAFFLYGTNYSNLAIENNAFQGCRTFINFVDATSVMGTLDYNVYMVEGAGGNNSWGYSGFGTNTFSSWKSTSGSDTHSIYSTSDALNSDGSPTSSFPGLNTGPNPGINLTGIATANLAPLTSDTSNGNSRTPTPRPASGSWTIGAYELDPPGGQPTPPTGLAAVVQ